MEHNLQQGANEINELRKYEYLRVENMPPLATLVLAEQHGGNRPPVLFPHQGSSHPENLNNSIFGGIFIT